MIPNPSNAVDSDCPRIKDQFYIKIYQLDRQINTDMSTTGTNNFNLIEIWKSTFPSITDFDEFLKCVNGWDIVDEGFFNFDRPSNMISLTDTGRNWIEEELIDDNI